VEIAKDKQKSGKLKDKHQKSLKAHPQKLSMKCLKAQLQACLKFKKL
jgi:hypothetical protein